MAQPIKDSKKVKKPIKKKVIGKRKRNHPKYGTSKLEDKFAREFLDKLNIPYERQFEAKDIGRFYDFKIGNYILIEVDGCFWHGKGLVHEEKSPMQKHSEWVDKQKNEWANSHGYVLYRIWEDDINNNPTLVMKELKDALGIEKIKNDKNKRH